MSLPLVSVVIPCRNERAYIVSCIQSVLQNDYPKELIELFVCDGMSDDGTLELLNEVMKNFPQLTILENEKRTTPFALNLGIKKSKGDVVIILGAHAELQNNYISTCVSVLQKNPEVWCAGGVLKNEAQDFVSSIVSLAMTSPFGVGSAHFRTGMKDGEVDTVAFGAYRKEVFQLIGNFDEELTRNQDDEFNFRLTQAGKKIRLTTSTSIKYFVRGSWSKLWRQYFQYGYWKVFVNRKHKVVTTVRQLIPFLFVSGLIGGFILSFFSKYFLWLYLIFIALYLVCALLAASMLNGSKKNLIQIVFAFILLHLSYGFGYLKGVIDFLLLRKKSASLHDSSSR